MPQVGEVTPIDKPKSMTKHRAEIIKSVFIPLVKRVVLLEMDKDGIGPYSRLEIREAIASLETFMRRKTGEEV